METGEFSQKNFKLIRRQVGDSTEMTVFLAWNDRGDDWLSRGFKVVLPGDDFETVSGEIWRTRSVL